MSVRTTEWRLYRRVGTSCWWAQRVHRGKRERKSTGYSDREDAEATTRVWNRAAADPAHAAATTKTVADAINAHRKYQTATEKSDATLAYNATKLGHFARIVGEHRPLIEVDASVMETYVIERRSDNVCLVHRRDVGSSGKLPCATPCCRAAVSLSTLKKEQKCIKAVLARARRLGWYPHDPGQVIEVVEVSATRVERWAHEDVMLGLFERIKSRFGPFHAAHLAWFCGSAARRVEAERARRDHVRDDGTLLIPGTKTELSNRTVLITDIMAPWLERALDLAPRGRELLLVPWSNLNRDLALACKDIGIGRLSPNDLRRSVASWHHHASIPDEDIAKLLGHASPETTRKFYVRNDTASLKQRMAAHISPEALASVLARRGHTGLAGHQDKSNESSITDAAE